MKKLSYLVIIPLLYLGLIGCARNISPNAYNPSEIGAANKVEPGIVVSKRLISLETSTGENGQLAGTVAGTGLGATMGSTLANHMSPGLGLSTLIVSSVAGAVAGGVGGNVVDKAINRQQGYEYLIKLRKGTLVSVVQNLDLQFAVHQRVLVIYGARTRLIADTLKA